MTSPERLAALRAAADHIFGGRWHAALATALGPLHPTAPRQALSSRLVRSWDAEEAPVPHGGQSTEAAFRRLTDKGTIQC